MNRATCGHEVNQGITCTIDDGQIFSDGSKAYSYGTYCWECLKERGVEDVHNSEVRKALKENARLQEELDKAIKINSERYNRTIDQLLEEYSKLKDALNKIANEKYERPTDMMLIARKALQGKEE